MKFCALFVLATTLLVGSARASVVEIVRIWPGYRTAESFESVGELFGKGEATGGRTVLRSQPDARAGYYFLTRIRLESAIPQAQVRMEVILPGSLEPKAYTFALSLAAGSTVLAIGVTGTDWPERDLTPLAWRLTVLDRTQPQPLAEKKSFLWAVP